MSSSSTATSAGEEITFPPSSASEASAASASESTNTTEAEDAVASVVSYVATEGDADADSAVSEDCDSRGASHGNSFGNGMSNGGESAPGGNNGAASNKNNGEGGDEYKRTHGTCEFYPTSSNSSSCQIQRSCYDCLNFNITSEPNGCFVNSLGICKRVSDYNPALDYRLGHAANNYSTDGSSSSSGSSSLGANVGDDGDDRYDFLASAATYCDQNDAQCLSCIANQFAAVIYNNSGDSRSSYCYGTNNCICVAVCEARRLNPPHMDSQCFANTMSVNQATEANNYGSVFMLIGAMVMVVIVVFAIYRVRTRGETGSSDASDDSNNNNNNVPMNRRTSDDDRADIIITPDHNASPIAMAVPVPVRSSSSSIGKGQILLNLFNWQAMREVLVQREQMRLEGIDPAALSPDTTGLDTNGEPNVDKGDVQFLDVKPSAPEVEKDVASAPAVPVITVPSAPVVWTVRAMAGPASPSAPSAPDFDDFEFEDVDAADMRAL